MRHLILILILIIFLLTSCNKSSPVAPSEDHAADYLVSNSLVVWPHPNGGYDIRGNVSVTNIGHYITDSVFVRAALLERLLDIDDHAKYIAIEEIRARVDPEDGAEWYNTNSGKIFIVFSRIYGSEESVRYVKWGVSAEVW